MTTFTPGALVSARGREWVVVTNDDDDLIVLRPLGGGDDERTAVVPSLEPITSATFPPPGLDDLGDATGGALLRTALRIGFRSSGGPFRSLARVAVEPRAYQYVPLLLALRQDPVRLLIADDVGIGKTVESGLIAAELLAQGDIRRLAVLCSPALAEQWGAELHDKFAIDAAVVLPSTAGRLSRGLMMAESLFERYPFAVVSTDFIKSPNRRQEFLNHCPELVIVDEAHTAVADGAGGGPQARTQRYDLLRAVAKDRSRHLVLVTATPHSGKEAGFRNLLGLLDPDLATVNLDDVNGRALLARHFVQRRRADIRRYLDEDTAFPSDRETRDSPYDLSPEYAALFDRVLAYARSQVRDASGTGVRQRVRWWSALALLRALSSSPAAAAATLRTRASNAGADSVDEADRLGRATVLDSSDDDAVETIDTAPGALTDTAADGDIPNDSGTGTPSSERRRLLELARTAETLAGPAKDRKLALLIDEVKRLLADGYDPVVFCRFIDTADYVADHLSIAIGKAAAIASVTGVLPPALRQERIAELTRAAGRHVLVATDCLSEGVNLQEHFQAVVHYDLAWNPTRHEQREGRVDRFGQTRDVVRAVTVYGRNNRVDEIVLDVLIRKYRAIRAATGVSIPVPDNTDNVVGALVESLILTSDRDHADQLTLDVGLDEQRQQLHATWESTAAREHASRTKYAQEAIHPDDIAREVTAARRALGDHGEIAEFTVEALRALGAAVSPFPGGWKAVTAPLPIGLRDSLPAGHPEPLPLHLDLPAPRSHAVLARTDPTVEAVARYVLDTALDSGVGTPIAARAGVIRTRAVTRRTTVLLVRIRLHLDLPSPGGIERILAEEARFASFAGPPESAEWLGLGVEATEALLAADPDGNVTPEAAANLVTRVTDNIGALNSHLDELADRWAAELLDAHRRVRTGSGATRRGLAVTAEKPVDLLGVYVYLPVAVT